MNLINFVDYKIQIEPNLLLVKPFRKMFKSDRTKDKEHFMEQISYIYFMYDPRSTYNYITNEEEKSNLIIRQEGLEPNFKPDATMEDAIDIYKKQVITKSAELLQSTYIACDKVIDYLEDMDLNKVDDKGKPLYKVQDIVNAIERSMGLMDKLQIAKKKVEQEVTDSVRTKGTTDNKAFESGFNFDE